MRKIDLLSMVVAAAAAFGVWAWTNQPVTPVDADVSFYGSSFQPGLNWNPAEDAPLSASEIEEDVRILQGQVRSLRTYAVAGGLERVPEIAARNGMTVMLGVWIGRDLAANRAEIEAAVRLANRSRGILGVIVGNEAVLRGDVAPPLLAGYMAEVRRRVTQPVSTAEPWNIWLKHPELARDADFIAAHILPYWEGIHIDNAVGHTLDRYWALNRAFPGMNVLLTEVGWPSRGRTVGDAEASLVNQARFVRGFVAEATARKMPYYLMEAFDQPWKAGLEGGVGAYWGLYDAGRTAKFPLAGAVVELPEWRQYALAGVLLALPATLLFLAHARHIRALGRFVYLLLIQGLAAGAVLAAVTIGAHYLLPGDVVVFAALGLSLLLLAFLLLAEAYELVEVAFGRGLARVPGLAPADGPRAWPKAAIHVAICNEPPAMVKLTLDSLAALDYPNLQVVVIDNNTKDEAVWRPVEAHCRALGERFTFVHVDHCPGFKAGALNIARRYTDADAAVIGVIDADYTVTPDWLRLTIPLFDRPQVALVQAPQDHRDTQGSWFKQMIGWEYAGFFNIGMVQRNERNAIIQHGTMCLVRSEALDAVGGWSEWCICEDSELGLRLLERGDEAIYLNRSFGQGLSPDSWQGYRRQRYRWAYGGMRILSHHLGALLPWTGRRRHIAGQTGSGVGATKLTLGQRYQFLAGWLPWLSDGLFLALIGLSLLWTAACILDPVRFDAPLTVFSLPALGFIVFKILASFTAYALRVPCGIRARIGAMLAGLALTLTIGQAVIAGLTTTKLPFHRTPKLEGKAAILKGLIAARLEATIGALLLAGAVGMLTLADEDGVEARIWAATLVLQALPCLATIVLSLASAMATVSLPEPAALLARTLVGLGRNVATTVGGRVSAQEPAATAAPAISGAASAVSAALSAQPSAANAAGGSYGIGKAAASPAA